MCSGGEGESESGGVGGGGPNTDGNQMNLVRHTRGALSEDWTRLTVSPFLSGDGGGRGCMGVGAILVTSDAMFSSICVFPLSCLTMGSKQNWVHRVVRRRSGSR